MQVNRIDTIHELKTEILRLEGFRPCNSAAVDMGLGPLLEALPNGSFPLGAVHEFLSGQPEDAAATSGFISGLIAPLMGSSGTTLWISSARTLFPPALKSFGIQPDSIIFIDLKKERDVLWAMDEALKCGALTAVIGEIQEMSFTASRRLQLAVEQSRVTGFILRHNFRKVNPTACVSRWRITSLPSVPIITGGYRDGLDEDEDLPGIGFPQWKVELLRIRNGKPAIWEIIWASGKFIPSLRLRQTGLPVVKLSQAGLSAGKYASSFHKASENKAAIASPLTGVEGSRYLDRHKKAG